MWNAQIRRGQQRTRQRLPERHGLEALWKQRIADVRRFDPDGRYVGIVEWNETGPWSEVVGPVVPRGGPAGGILGFLLGGLLLAAIGFDA